jgi:hypothetical protein
MTISVPRTAGLTVAVILSLAAPSGAATFEQLHEQNAYPGLASQAAEAIEAPASEDGPAYRFAAPVTADAHAGDAGDTATPSGDGLDWGSAAIGAGMAIGLALVALAATLAVVRSRAPSPTT